MFQDTATLSQGVPDALVTLRQFVGGFNAALNDQSYTGYDGMSVNPSGQFATVGPYGTAVEGQPLTITRAGGVTLSPALVLLALGAAAVLLLKR